MDRTRASRNVDNTRPRRRFFRGGHALLVGLLAFTGVGVASVYMTSMMQNPPTPEVEEWVNLRDSLSAKRIAQRRGEEVPSEASAFLAQADANAAVSAAKSAMANNTQAAEAIWRDAFIEAVEEQQEE